MVSHAAQRSSIALKLKRNSQPYCVTGHVCVPAAQAFVLVMGSKNNNGKFDFKAAGQGGRPQRGKSPAGLSYDHDLNGVSEL